MNKLFWNFFGQKILFLLISDKSLGYKCRYTVVRQRKKQLKGVTYNLENYFLLILLKPTSQEIDLDLDQWTFGIIMDDVF